MSDARGAACSIGPMPKQSAHFMSGPARSSGSGGISCIASRNAPRPRVSKAAPLRICIQGEIMISTATRIEDLTLNITQEIHVKASLETTFAALLEQLGPYNDTPDGQAMALK